MPGSYCRHCGWNSMKEVKETCPECGYKALPTEPQVSIPVKAEVVTKEGMRVHVFSPDKQSNWGLGTLLRVKDGGCSSQIELDNGGVFEVTNCRWYPVTMKRIFRVVKEIMAAGRNVNPSRMSDYCICRNPVVVFRRVTEDVFGEKKDEKVHIAEPLTVSELTSMIWQYVQ